MVKVTTLHSAVQVYQGCTVYCSFELQAETNVKAKQDSAEGRRLDHRGSRVREFAGLLCRRPLPATPKTSRCKDLVGEVGTRMNLFDGNAGCV